MIYYSTAYSMRLVFKALCYLDSDFISLKDFKLFQLKVLILTKLSCVVVYLRALFYDPFCLFFIHNLSLVLFLNIQYLTCCLDDCLSSILCVEKCVSDVKTWMTSNKLQMNEDKMDVLLVTAK